jgi:type IV pilus assembly protein PilE
MYTAQVQKSRRADAKVALEMVAAAQERFFTLNGTYAATLSSLSVSPDIQGGASNEGYYDISVNRTAADQFTATADTDSGAAQASDSDCAQFTLNQVGNKGATSANCW